MQVVAGVIELEGRILICQRRAGGRHPFKWEFPGGKVEADESPRDALVRELKEELAIDVVAGPQMAVYDIQYPESPSIQLLFFRVDQFNGEPQNLEFEAIEWVEPKDLPTYDFLDGDLAFINRLALGL